MNRRGQISALSDGGAPPGDAPIGRPASSTVGVAIAARPAPASDTSEGERTPSGAPSRAGGAARRARGPAPWWYALRRRPQFVVAAPVVALVVASALFAPFLAPHDPLDQSFTRSLEAPSARYLFGTDEFGRDVLSRILWGARITLGIALAATTAAALAGSVLGIVGGFKGGLIDIGLMRVVDAVLAFPGLLLVIGLVATLGPTHAAVVAGIAVAYTPTFARLARAMVLRERGRDYVLAARTIGQRPTQIVLRHILPNVLRILLVQATLSIGHAMLAEASLSYLGLANQPWEPSWGRMVLDGRRVLELAPHATLFPLAVLSAAILAFNLIGDAVSESLDPVLRRGA